MPQTPSNNSTVARQVEFSIGRLESLCTLPCVGARLFSKLTAEPFSPAVLADVIEADPALASKMLRLLGLRGIRLVNENFSLRTAMSRIPAGLVRDSVLSVKVSNGSDGGQNPLKKGLFLHSLAVACCAESIARIAPVGVEPQLAYLGGLLHDIGKLAMEDAMPKSLDRVVEQAESSQSSCLAVEQGQFGADHTIFGKRLAQKWRLPDEIALAVWLHHSDTAAVCAAMPGARIAQIVQLADSIARQCGIGISGSYDSPEPMERNALSLGVDLGQLDQISKGLLSQVGEKSNLLGLDSPNAVADYGKAAGAAAIHFAGVQTELAGENSELKSASGHLDFASEFLASIDSTAGVMDVAESFAQRWQKFYQTGTVCLYLARPAGVRTVDAVVVEALGHSRVVCMEVPDRTQAVPKRIAGDFAILEAHDYIGWLFEQLEVEFAAGATKLIPLLCNGSAVGAMAFELHYPGDETLFAEKFRLSSSMAGAVLDLALSSAKQQWLAEHFVQLASGSQQAARPEQVNIPLPSTTQEDEFDNVEALAELAAGAAHELNNPLAVLSGRAQLLADSETDQEKKDILTQVQSSARKACGIVEDLMGFAEPPTPKGERADVKRMIDEAVLLASRKTSVESINVDVEVGEGAEAVFADSAQISSALANVLTNAVESYDQEVGPIKITADLVDSGGRVRLQVMDLGCGMDENAIRNAITPFYSAKDAGRKRGMGLAYAARFAQINGGKLEIESHAGVGTTVTILLPCG